METRIVSYEQAKTVSEITIWANDLIGKEVPGVPGYRVVSILRFQLLSSTDGAGYSAMLLVEVMQEQVEEQIALREADIVAIEQITSTVDDGEPGEDPVAQL